MILIALADVGQAMPLEEQLAGARWDASCADGPTGAHAPEVVLVDGDRLGARLPAVAAAWRARTPMPGIVAIGASAVAREHAPAARVTLIAPTAQLATLRAAIAEAAQLRHTVTIDWPTLCAALTVPTDSAITPQLLAAARALEIAAPALRWHARDYVTPTARLDELRDDRVLTVPELDVAATLDGTRTVQAIVTSQQAARVLWLLGALGAIEFTADVRDVATPARRLLAELRAHLRARAARLASSTYYDVLEVTPLAEYADIEAAYQLVALRFSPEALDPQHHDLAELASAVKPTWDLVEKARSVLVDDAARGRYHDWLRQHAGQLRTVWAIEPAAAQAATDAFVRGQRALGDGDVHKAMSEFAAACRTFPGHPEYEANLAWARYRVQVASGLDRVEGAMREAATVEAILRGCRPWPRALVALALLRAAAGDADSARWHLHFALTVDPSSPAAKQLAQRLGMRR